MKMLVSDMLGVMQGLNSMANTPIKASLAFRFRSIAAKLKGSAESYEETRVELVKKMGETQADGAQRVAPGKMQAFSEALEEVHKQEIDVDTRRVSCKELSVEMPKMTMELVTRLEPILLDDVDDDVTPKDKVGKGNGKVAKDSKEVPVPGTEGADKK